MGIDPLRFVGEVDEEFHCNICSLVFENSVQTPCEHNFCGHCINEWLTVNQISPVDREPLIHPDLKPLNRSLRNLWNKLGVKCVFESEGCEEVVKLEHLENHLTKTCEYSRLTCDKGCNLHMIRREYERNNCFEHFKEQVRKYENQLSPELQVVLSNQTVYIEGFIKSQQEKNIELTEENINLKVLLENINFSSKSEYAPPIKWSYCRNMRHDRNLPNILEHEHTDTDMKTSYAQLGFFLKPKNSSFKVEILAGFGAGVTGSVIEIGLACSSYSFYYVPSVSIDNKGKSWHNGHGTFSVLPLIVDGDIVECGIKFPANFDQCEQNEVRVYFILNGQFMDELKTAMPKYGFYPTICFRYDEGNIKGNMAKPKIKYLSN